jgi:hypothetical protein
MKTPSHNGEKPELESFVCAVHTDSFGRKLFYDPHTHEQRPVINGNNRLLMGGSSERLGNAGVQELLHARIRIAFDLIGSADGDYAAFIEHRDALGNPKRQVAIMRYHKGRGMKGRHPLRGCDESDLFEFEALHQPSPQLARFCFFS